MSKKELLEKIIVLNNKLNRNEFKIHNLELEIKNINERVTEDIAMSNLNLNLVKKSLVALAKAQGGKLEKSKIIENDKIVEIITFVKKNSEEIVKKVKKAGRPKKVIKQG